MKLFPEMRYSFNGTFDGPRGTANGIKGDDPTAMWILQMVHPCKKLKDPSGKCVVFMDNFYTCHSLGQALKKMTDGEVRITGTCHLNYINKVNHIGVMKALALLEKEERGTWALIQAYDDEGNEKLLEPPGQRKKRKKSAQSKGTDKSQKKARSSSVGSSGRRGNKSDAADDEEDEEYLHLLNTEPVNPGECQNC